VAATRRRFRIESITEGQDLTRHFVAVTHDPNVYDDDFGDLEDFTDALPNVRGIPASASRVTATESPVVSSDGTITDAIAVTFDAVEAWQHAEIWYRVMTTAEGTWRFAGYARETTTIAPVAAGQAYEVAVAVVGHGGTRQRIQDAAKAAVYIRGYRSPPTAPTGLTLNVALGTLEVNAAISTDPTTVGYEIRYGTTWGGSVRIARSVALPWSGPCPFIGTETIRVRSITRAGVVSESELTGSVTHTAAASTYTADLSSDEHPGFAGTKTDTVVTGSELALDTGDLSGTYQTADKVCAGGTQVVYLRARCKLADVAMLVEEACFDVASVRAQTLTLAGGGPFLDGFELAEHSTVGNAMYTLDSLPGLLYTVAGPIDIQSALVPTIEYDVNTGSGFSGSWTTYTGPFTAVGLVGVRSRVTLRRPHTRYDPRLVEYNTTTLSTASTGGGGGDPWDFDEGDAGATYGTGTIDFDEGSA